MDCSLASVCGGCSLRHLDEKEYRQRKCAVVQKALQSITRQDFVFSEPVFIKEGCRRRASFAFRRAGGGIVLGFNAYRSNEIVDLPGCPQLTPALNRGLEFFRGLLSELCRVPLTVKEGRKGRAKTVYVEKGDLWLTEADNGLDAVLEFAFDSRDTGSASDYLPHNYPVNSVAYTGTHDNETLVSWYQTISDAERAMVRDYLYDYATPDEQLYKSMIALILRSAAARCIIPMQDWLGLDNAARINKPSTVGQNWRWRLKKTQLTKKLQKEICQLTTRYGRMNWA